MTRLVSTIAAITLAALAAPVALSAQPAGAYFTAELAEPTQEDSVIAGGVVFTCEGTVCTGPRSRDRDLRVCSELRREVGTITRFTVRGEELPTRNLSRCNG